MMTQMKEREVELIERIPDEKKAMEALQNVLKFSGRLPEDFDADKELQEAREEKYGNIG